MEINGYLWAAQAASVASTGLAVSGVGLFIAGGVAAMMADTNDRDFTITFKILRGAAVAVAASIVFGMAPSRETMLWSLAVEHGPEYVERLISAIEAKN